MKGAAAVWPTRWTRVLSFCLPERLWGSHSELRRRSRSLSERSRRRRALSHQVSVATPPKRQPEKMVRSFTTSDFHRDDLLDEVEPDELEADGDAEELSAGVVGEEHSGVAGVQGVGDDEEDHGEGDEDVAGESAFGGDGFYVLLEADAAADHRADVPEDFGEVAAGLALNEDG